MAIFLPSLALACAAFCVWLTVRIVNRRERWARWMAIALIASQPVLYVLSFGPACWLVTKDYSPDSLKVLQAVYWPVVRGAGMCPDPVHNEFRGYVESWLPPYWKFIAKTDADSLWFFFDERMEAGDYPRKSSSVELESDVER